MKMKIVQFADTGGAGFTRQPDPAQPVDREYWASAQKLMQREVVQPPELVKATRGHPVWGMRRTMVGGERVWCFWLQGRGGEFGPAGTCRFGFTDALDHPVRVWLAGVEQVARQPLELTEPDTTDADVMYRVIGAIALGTKQISIPSTPTQAARVIRGVLGVLPPAEIEERVWATCLLQPLDDQAVVAAPLPESIAVAQYVRRIDRTLGATLGGTDVVASKLQALLQVPDRAEGVKTLAGHAAKGVFIYDQLESSPQTFIELLDCVNSELSGLTVLQVRDLMATAEGRKQLMAVRDLVEQWAEAEPGPALDRVRELPLQPIVDRVFAGLVQRQSKEEHDVIGWPVPARADRIDEVWPAKLGQLLKRHFNPTEMIAFIKELERRGVLSRPDLVRGRDVLLAAGLRPKSARDLFPLTVELIAASLRSAAGLTADMRDEITAYRDDDPSGSRLKLLSTAVMMVSGEGGLRPMTPGDALYYFRVVDLGGQPATEENGRLAEQLAGCLTRAALSSSNQAVPWLVGFLKGLNGFGPGKQGLKMMAALGPLRILDQREFSSLRTSDRESLNKVVKALGVWEGLSQEQQTVLQAQAPSPPRHAAHEPSTAMVRYVPPDHERTRQQREPSTQRVGRPPAAPKTSTTYYGRPKWKLRRGKPLAFAAAVVIMVPIMLFALSVAGGDGDKDPGTAGSARPSSPSPSPSPSPRRVIATSTIAVASPLNGVLSEVDRELGQAKAQGQLRITRVVVSGNLPPDQRGALDSLLNNLLARPDFVDAKGDVADIELVPAGQPGIVRIHITFERQA